MIDDLWHKNGAVYSGMTVCGFVPRPSPDSPLGETPKIGNLPS
jgi:hypothetical protein